MTSGGGRRAALDVVLVAALQAIGGLKSFLLLPIIARTLDAEAYGIWSQVSVSVALLTAVAMLRLDSACIRYYAGPLARAFGPGEGEPAPQVLGQVREGYFSALAMILGTLAALGALAWGLAEPLSRLFFGAGTPSHWALLLWAKLATAVLLTFALAYYRARQRIRFFASMQLAVDLGGLATMTALLVLAGVSLELAVIALCALEGLAAAGLLLATAMQLTRWSGGGSWRFAQGELRRLLALSAPLVPYMLAIWVINYVDRFVILDQLGLAQVGVYAAAYMLGNLAQFVVGPVNVVLYPLLAARWSVGEKASVARLTADTARIYVALSVPLLLALVVAAPPLLVLLTGNDSFRVAPTLVFMIAAGVLLSGLDQLFRNVLILAERTRWFFPLTAPLAVANLLLNLWWVPRFGLSGAAAATLLVLVVKAWLLGTAAQRTLPLGLPWRDLGLILGGGAALSVAWWWGLSLVFEAPNPWLYLILTLGCYAGLLTTAGVLRRVDPVLAAALLGNLRRFSTRISSRIARRVLGSSKEKPKGKE
ncbi:MAG: lipopolysaccharide biosynthesis protein [Acidobacteriota bacterium]